MKKRLMKFVVPLLLVCAGAQAKDGFEGVSCGSDVPRALAGRHMSNERVVVLEGRHTALGLKDLGGEEISDSLNSTSWSICGKEYMVLTDANDVVGDVLAVPPHSRSRPAFGAGTCQVKGKKINDPVIAVLDNHAAGGDDKLHHYSPQDTTLLPAVAAWKIDEKAGKFIVLSASGITCPRSGIVTVDGGP